MSERKKPGRKPRVIDIATYVCPRCNRVNGKQKNREMCPDCHVEYNRVRSREWHRRNKGRQQQAGRPKVGEWDRKESSKWLSVSLMPASLPDPSSEPEPQSRRARQRTATSGEGIARRSAPA